MTIFTTNRKVLWGMVATCMGLLAAALYLQHAKDMYPCPLCVIARYLYIGVALICVLAALAPVVCQKYGAASATLVAACGVGLSVYHQWVLAHPLDSCGIDPTKTMLNKIFTAEWLPSVFYASGMCSDLYPPILGLEIPMWSLVCFVGLTVVIGRVTVRGFGTRTV